MKFKTSIHLTLLAIAINGCNSSVETPTQTDDDTQTQTSSELNTQTDTSTPTDTSTQTQTSTPTDTDTGTNTTVSNSITLQENEPGLCLVDGTINDTHAGFTGNGFANTENALDQSIIWEVNATESAEATLEFRFANGGTTARSGNLDINGTSYTVDLESTGDWVIWSSIQITVNLNEGLNTLNLTSLSEDGLANIDSLQVTGSGVSSSDCIIDVVPEATETNTNTDSNTDTDTQTSQPTDTTTETETQTDTQTQTDISTDPIIVEGQLDRTNWILDASHNTDDLLLAIDNSASTRWSTGEVQNDTQWLSIDLGDYYTINTITLSYVISSEDYPRGYNVLTSTDGITWNNTVATGVGTTDFTTITFDDIDTQYIKIEQTGSDENSWWSIHEISVANQDDSLPEWTVANLQELRDAVTLSDQNIVLRPDIYSIEELADGERHFLVSGNNNTINITGSYIEFPVSLDYDAAHFYYSGAGNTLIGGTLENTYDSGLLEVTDFVSYNQDRNNLAHGGKPHMVIAGDDTTVLGTKMIVRGSFPYGYGSYFGIGGGNSFGLDKRGGIQINSANTILDGVELYMEAFGHGIYIGPGEGAISDNTIIRNTHVEGIIRLTNDLLAERGGLMETNNYLDSDGNPIPANDAETLSEDGIRTYPDAGSVIVENSVVKGMRGGIRLYNASVATVSNTSGIDNRLSNFQMSRDGEVTSSSANFTYGPALWVSNFKQNQEIDITIIPSPNAVGEHNIANIERENNKIILRRTPGPEDTQETRVINVTDNGSEITNYTEYTIVLAEGTNGNTVISAGEVIDNGDNDVTLIDLEL